VLLPQKITFAQQLIFKNGADVSTCLTAGLHQSK